MSTSLKLPTIVPWTLAATLAAAPAENPWSLLIVDSDLIEQQAADLKDQLESLLDDVQVDLVHARSASDAVEASIRRAGSALVLVGLEDMDPAAWRRLDAARSRLQRSLPAVMVLAEPGARLALEQAPNLWSWLAGHVWHGVPEEGLSDEQRKQRLSVLREHYGFDDAELVRRAEAGTLAAEPDLAEWLVLIGKGRLIGGERS